MCEQFEPSIQEGSTVPKSLSCPDKLVGALIPELRGWSTAETAACAAAHLKSTPHAGKDGIPSQRYVPSYPLQCFTVCV